ncbi:protein lsr2 [Mycobacteroides abscessus subsp. massiliense]|nr:protein lsr2 [Mycobacteroides abscessus subsp. massiliense]SKT97322.1 protein lsr2 [Mycobacteroides abscessus subsp. massiliense]
MRLPALAKHVVVTLIDDTDGRSVADETVSFGLDGYAYEIDLSGKNAKKIRDTMAFWAAHGRRLPGGRRRAGTKLADQRTDASEVRAWLRDRGHEISDRGRIPVPLRQQFDEANAPKKKSKPKKAARTAPK